MNKNFSDTGYTILKKAISIKLVKNIQTEIYNLLNNSKKINVNHKKNYLNLCKKIKNSSLSEFKFVKPIYEFLFYKGYIDKVLLENKLFKSLTNLLGNDLAYVNDPALTLNLPKKSSPQKNYLYKDWHQEIWSGSSASSIQIWTPIFQKNSSQGQMELIVESHKWGHIPHRNRKPLELPKNYKTKKLNLEYGDVIIFSTLLLHRSIKTDYPRLALPVLVKNFRYKDYSFQENRSWKIFSYSELTKIERILGNHHLSPFRVIDINSDITSGTIRKN